MRLHRVARSLLVLAAASALPGVAGAQGFGLNEIGSCAIGRGQALTGAPCADASSIYWNPAAPIRLKGISAYGGAAAISVKGDYTADTTGRVDQGDVPTVVAPHLFANWTNPTNRYALGVGVYVPYGLTSQWKSDFPGRFSALKAALASIYVQPNVAIALGQNWSIGGGPVIGHSSVELKQALDLSQQSPATGVTFAQLGIAPGTEFAVAKLKGSATAYGFHLGVHGNVTPTFSVGARYLSEIKFKYDDADATFTQTSTGLTLSANNPLGFPAGTPVDALLAPEFTTGGALEKQKVKTQINHPAQFEAGLGWTGLPGTLLSLDYAWIGWKAFKELPVEFQGGASGSNRTLIEDYKDSWAVRVGAEHGFGTFTGRAGFSYVNTPVPDETVTPLLPDMNRYNFNVGVGVPLGKNFALDGGYMRVETEGRRGRIIERTSRDQTAADVNGGWYSLNANVFTLSLKANY